MSNTMRNSCLLLVGWLLLPLQAQAVTIEMVNIPGGSFSMGSNDGDEDETPVHTVKINSFKIGKFEVTQEQWQEVMGHNPSKYKGDYNPVEMVNWNDVQTFIKKLNAKTGKHYRLPTEAEWEYAARAGTTTKWSWGDNAGAATTTKSSWGDNAEEVNKYAWNKSNSSSPTTHVVGTKLPNPWGLYESPLIY